MRGADGASRHAAPGQWVAIAVFGLSGVAAFGLVPEPRSTSVPTQLVRLDLPLPALSIVEADAAGYWRHDRIRRGDTIGSVLARLGVDDTAAMEFLRTNPSARALYQLRPGKALNVETDADGRLLTLHFVTGDGDPPRRSRATASGSSRRSTPAPTEVRWKMAAGEIRTSLFGAADAAGLPDAVTMQLADVFGGDIDFYLDLRRGDRFSVVYEMRYVDGEAVGSGPHRRGRIREPRPDDPRVPLAQRRRHAKTTTARTARRCARRSCARRWSSSRVTSGFSGARFHPILQNVARAQGRRLRGARSARRCARPATPRSSSPARRTATAT